MDKVIETKQTLLKIWVKHLIKEVFTVTNASAIIVFWIAITMESEAFEIKYT